MSLKAEQISNNYEKHIKIIDHYIGDRKDSDKTMIEKLGEEYIMAPASGKTCRPKDITINGGSASDVPIRWAGSTAPSNMSTNGDEDIHTLTLVRRPDTTAWMAFCNFSMGMGS